MTNPEPVPANDEHPDLGKMTTEELRGLHGATFEAMGDLPMSPGEIADSHELLDEIEAELARRPGLCR